MLKNREDEAHTEEKQLIEHMRQQLDKERASYKQSGAPAEIQNMVEEARRQLDEERKRHAGEVAAQQSLLSQRERGIGDLTGQADNLSAEASYLRDRIADLHISLREAESKCGKQRQVTERLQL